FSVLFYSRCIVLQGGCSCINARGWHQCHRCVFIDSSSFNFNESYITKERSERMRDVQFLPLDETYELVIAVDNIGGVGLKENDIVNVDYETVGHFGMRVAMLECLATGAQPLSAMIHNFCGDEAWQPLVSGVKQTLRELGIEHISITGSTESNFSLIQSAVGFLAIGKVKKNEKKI